MTRTQSRKISFGGLLACALLLLPALAQATFIRILAASEASLDDQTKTVNLTISITNDGDEDARDIMAAFPLFNESYPVKGNLAPKESAKYQGQFSFEKLQIAQPGAYHLPFQVTYQDMNAYPFSAPFISKVVYGVAPSKALLVDIKSIKAGNTVDLTKESTVSAALMNLTDSPVQVNALTPFGSSEIPSFISGLNFPLNLKGRQSMPFELTLKNAGALVGSQYVVYLLASGEVGGKHLAEEFSVGARIINPQSFANMALIVIFGVLLLVVVYKWRRTKKP